MQAPGTDLCGGLTVKSQYNPLASKDSHKTSRALPKFIRNTLLHWQQDGDWSNRKYNKSNGIPCKVRPPQCYSSLILPVIKK